MKKTLGLMVLLVASTANLSALAAEIAATGKVQKIFALDRAQLGADADHILITGFATAGSCITNDGLIALVLRNDDGGQRQLSIALAAKLSDRPVVVRVDDAFKNSTGQCYLRYLELF